MALAHGEAVETHLLGEHRAVDHFAQPICGTLLLTRYGVRMVRNQRQQQKLQCSSSTSGCLVVVTPTTPSGPCRRSGRPTDVAQHEPRPGPVHSRLGQPAGYDSETMPHRSSSRLRRTPEVLLSKASRWTSRVTAAVLR